MDAGRAGTWDRAAGAAGLVLLIALFLPFYFSNGETASAWSAFGLIDKLILLTAFLAIALPVVAMLKPTHAGPQKLGVVLAGVAALSLICAIYRLFNHAEFDRVAEPVELRFGAFLVVAALVAVLASALLALRDRRAHRMAPRSVAASS